MLPIVLIVAIVVALCTARFEDNPTKAVIFAISTNIAAAIICYYIIRR